MDVEEIVLTWREDEATPVDALMAATVPGADEEVFEEDEEIALCLLLLLQRTMPYKVSVAPSERKVSEVHMSLSLFQMTSSCDINLSSSRCLIDIGEKRVFHM